MKTLNAQEDRLEALDREVQSKTKERNECRDRLNDALAKLEYEAEV